MNGQTYKIALIAGLVALAASTQFYVYETRVRPQEAAAAGLQALTSYLGAQKQVAPAEKADASTASASVPELLARVQELALASGASVQSIEPDTTQPDKFKLEMDAPYANFTKFLARFEGLQVTVSGFDIAPPEKGGTLHESLTFAHSPGETGARPSAIRAFDEKLRHAALRDPFDPVAPPAAPPPDPDANDLTWTYHLTGISEIGAQKFATIDGHDYAVGDAFLDQTVSEIGSDHVVLFDKTGGKERRRVIKFREGEAT